MPDREPSDAVPVLPQNENAEKAAQRAFQLSLARTKYNYMRTYPNLEPLPVSGDIPSGEELGLEYNAKLATTVTQLAENFVDVAVDLIGDEFKTINFNLLDDIKALFRGTLEVFSEAYKFGPTAFLRSALFDLLAQRQELQPTSLAAYDALIKRLPKPLIRSIEPKPWMPSEGEPWEHDWFFGYLQVAGFNTTCLRGVVLERSREHGRDGIVLAELLDKLRVTDEVLQLVSGDKHATLHEAARRHRLFACDYALLKDAKPSKFHDAQRYLAAPIALFYWNESPPKGSGYPESYGGTPGPRGALQAIAIQLEQDPGATIFTPNDCAGANDAYGFKWKIAKYAVNMACVIQHESVAHLGECHLVIEPIVLATHRQLAERHPIFKLLAPHMRYTISINRGALTGLIVPGGVVATNVGPEISSTLELIVKARRDWRWDDNHPEHIFELRGVGPDDLPDFPFRDDTLQLWKAIKSYVRSYLGLYYQDEADLLNDSELQAWVNELVSPEYAALHGLDGLIHQPDGRVGIDDFEYLAKLVAQIIYIAGPLHASVNFAQYPLGAYAPAASGVMYKEPPTRNTELTKEEECLAWYPPLDVALYTISFVYLLSGVQFDRLGQYTASTRLPYFDDARAQRCLDEFQDALSLIEVEINRRNRQRPVPYPYQVPSQVPNSISI